MSVTVEELKALPGGSVVVFASPADTSQPEEYPATEHPVTRVKDDNYYRDFVSAWVPSEYTAEDLASQADVRIVYVHEPREV